MNTVDYLDVAAVIIPLIVIAAQLIFNYCHDKERDQKLHEWEDELARLQGRLERGCEYYRSALILLDDVAAKISFATEMIIGRIDYEKLCSSYGQPVDEKKLSEYGEKYKLSLDHLFAIRGKIAATTSNEFLADFTQYTTYIASCMSDECEKEPGDHVDTHIVKIEETKFLIKIREEKISMQKDLFEGKSFDAIKD